MTQVQVTWGDIAYGQLGCHRRDLHCQTPAQKSSIADRLLLLGLSPDTDEIRVPHVISIPETRIECMTPSIASRDKG